MDPLRHVKPAVRAVKAYTLAARRAPVKINQNENPYDLPESVKRGVVQRALMRPWSRIRLRSPRAAAALAASPAPRRVPGNGSNELIQALLLVTGVPARGVIPEPTFTLRPADVDPGGETCAPRPRAG
jgi:histidinol-phosphate/aromatic aminotransferase/cobyric acid decarboxylase-like protein